ncbi:hypothetical protein BGZ65_001060, partial [Modicella reniformis]
MPERIRAVKRGKGGNTKLRQEVLIGRTAPLLAPPLTWASSYQKHNFVNEIQVASVSETVQDSIEANAGR